MFRKHYANFSEEEKYLCDLMRGVTRQSLARQNQEVLTVLEKHPDRIQELPSFPDWHAPLS